MAIQFENLLKPDKKLNKNIKALLDICIRKGCFITPQKYGDYFADTKVKGKFDSSDYKAIIEIFEKSGLLLLEHVKDYLQIITEPDVPYIDAVIFSSNKKNNVLINDTQLLDNIIDVLSPAVSFSATDDCIRESSRREIAMDGYTKETYTVKDYSEGLTNAYWRMWFSEEYVNFIGKDRLDNAPTLISKYENGIYFVQLFEDPNDWNTPESIQAVEAFKDAVGRDMFYDPDNPDKVLSAPDFRNLISD